MLCDVIGDAYNIIERSYSHRNRSELSYNTIQIRINLNSCAMISKFLSLQKL